MALIRTTYNLPWILLAFHLLLPGAGSCQSTLFDNDLVFLRPVGKADDSLSIMEPWPTDDTLAVNVHERFLNSFIQESVRLYDYVQNYAVNTGKIEGKEPMYVAFTDRQGGFPVGIFQGYFLILGG